MEHVVSRPPDPVLLSGVTVVFDGEVVEDGWLRTDGELISKIGRGEPAEVAKEEVVGCAGKTIVPRSTDSCRWS